MKQTLFSKGDAHLCQHYMLGCLLLDYSSCLVSLLSAGILILVFDPNRSESPQPKQRLAQGIAEEVAGLSKRLHPGGRHGSVGAYDP
jgi:hypothetical protein